jgi:hypothetical protein
MRKFIVGLVLAAALVLPAAASATGPTLDVSQLATSQCAPSGAAVVDVYYGLKNDYDSGYAGNAWANDSILRHLRVWPTIGGYCGIVQDAGVFSTFAGPSPSGLSTVSAGILGVLGGGYRSTVFTGTFAPSAYATSGYLGTFDLACTSASNCPGARPSPLKYFTGTSGFDLAWWGWQYVTRAHGTWVNSIDTTAATGGDITG